MGRIMPEGGGRFHENLHRVGDSAGNATLRKRFGISDKNYPIASRIIRDTIAAGLIKSHDQASESKKDAKYVPFWA
jgi:hypothetical protein